MAWEYFKRIFGFAPEDPVQKIQNLEKEIRQMMTKLSTDCKGEPLRIVLFGAVKEGKSSLVNNILSAVKGNIVQTARSADMDDHVTKKYTEYKIIMPNTGDDEIKTHLVVCDTRGIDKTKKEEQANFVKAALEGYYAPNEDMNRKPTADDKKREGDKKRQAVHIILVVDATQVKKEKDDRSEMIKSIIEQNEAIPVSLFLTKCDRLDGEVSRDIRNLNTSARVMETRNIVYGKFKFVPQNRIFPIVNYTRQTEAEPHMRLQTLRALKVILGDIQSYVIDVVRDG